MAKSAPQVSNGELRVMRQSIMHAALCDYLQDDIATLRVGIPDQVNVGEYEKIRLRMMLTIELLSPQELAKHG